MEAAIIGVLGAGLLGLLGIFMQAIRSDLRSLGERMDARFQVLERAMRDDLGEVKDDLGKVKDDLGKVKGDLGEVRNDLGKVKDDLGEVKDDLGKVKDDLGEVKGDLGEVKERLAAIEATQAEHGRLLERMMDHGERIAALEGAAGAG